VTFFYLWDIGQKCYGDDISISGVSRGKLYLMFVTLNSFSFYIIVNFVD